MTLTKEKPSNQYCPHCGLRLELHGMEDEFHTRMRGKMPESMMRKYDKSYQPPVPCECEECHKEIYLARPAYDRVIKRRGDILCHECQVSKSEEYQ